MTGLILHLGHEDGLALERRSAANPVGLRLHADDLGVRVLGNLARQGLAIGSGHPVGGFDAGVFGDELVEVLLCLCFIRGWDGCECVL